MSFKQNSVQVAPSLLAADFGNIAAEIERINRSGADVIHLDVMDGRFVPRITFGDPVVAAVKKNTSLPLEVHLMTESPRSLVEGMIAAGAQRIIIHQEASTHLHSDLEYIRSKGCQAGVALNPGTPVSTVQHVLELCDVFLIMSVNPGWGGQSFLKATIPKIAEAKKLLIAQSNISTLIEVDGGINSNTANLCVEAGASILVAGSFFFDHADQKTAVLDLKK
jgi:ribulose-phosphate 3-epimerase